MANQSTPLIPAAADASRSHSVADWTLPAAMLLGVALRLYQLQSLDLDYDESATWYFASLPWSDLWGSPALLETNPPLFYCLAWLVRRAGGGIEQIRFISALAGILCIPVAWALARRLAGRFAAGAAAFLVATSATQIGTSQLARGYALLALAVLAALLCLVAARQKQLGGAAPRRQAGWWTGYGAASVVALYTHNTAPVILAACNAGVLAGLCFDRRAVKPFLRAWLTANLVVVAIYLFWVPVVLYQVVHRQASGWIARPSLLDFRYALMRVYGQPFLAFGQPFIDLIFAAAMLLGAWRYRVVGLAAGLAVGAVAGGPLLMFVISQKVPLIHAETLLWATPIGLVFVGLGCSALGKPRVPALVLLVALQLGADIAAVRAHADEWQQAAALLRRNLRPDDTLFIAGPGTALLLAHYGVPEQSMDTRAIANGEASWYRHFPGKMVAPDDVASQALALPRAWLVSRFWSDGHAAIAARLAARESRSLHYQSPSGGKGIEISLFEQRH
jgi:4-amino-4-deoxy-L-arabinose transferase-like glycosyltransferase